MTRLSATRWKVDVAGIYLGIFPTEELAAQVAEEGWVVADRARETNRVRTASLETNACAH